MARLPLIKKEIQEKVMGWVNTFAGTMQFSELLIKHRIPYLEEEQLNQVREERLA